MAEPAGTVGNPLVDAGTQVGTPVATMGFGARESADETRQAQHMEANDAPVDVNLNAMFARSQGLTIDAMGKTFASNDDARQKMSDSNNDFRQKMQDRMLAKAVP